ncbi:MAG: AGE family epimerase/isomerase [Bacteroidales bacterium]|jgi:mannobiose 2-epimerase|nr:AGE family epimerase/isomerase [Bacteroidales bacterium]
MQLVQQLLEENILAFWINNMQDHERGGFYGQIDGKGVLQPKASKGAVLNARILWTFSAAYRLLKLPKYLDMAERAFNYIRTFFIDPVYDGIYWELDCMGNPLNTKKQTYAQGFALYGFTEFYRATGNEQALELAKRFFFLLEKYQDRVNGGYFEAFTHDWQPIEDMRLSNRDANEKKTMNTHLHVLEPYSNLLRIWRSPQLENAQRKLLAIFIDRILNPQTHHLELFFDERWTPKSTAISFGHDIEASWLLYEAAEALGDAALTEKITAISLQIADAAAEGFQADGSMIYETDGQHTDFDRHWWVQAETVVGYLYAWRNSGNVAYKEKAERTAQYIRKKIVDWENGEWYWSRKDNGSVNCSDDKAGFWKCPYHNGRMCMEIISQKFNITI